MFDIMAGISDRHVMFPGPSPLLRGRYFPVAAAVKLVVTDLLEGSIEEFLLVRRASAAAISLDVALSSRKLRVNIKKGADGIGQLTEYEGQTKNCIRADFVVMYIEIVYDDRESTEADVIYFNFLPNSPLRCHPVMIANADENDSHDLSISLGRIEGGWEALNGGETIEIALGDLKLECSVVVVPAMYDEKLDRKQRGMMSSGASFACSYCRWKTNLQFKDPALVGKADDDEWRRTAESDAMAAEVTCRSAGF
jgi:hypothetical protein